MRKGGDTGQSKTLSVRGGIGEGNREEAHGVRSTMTPGSHIHHSSLVKLSQLSVWKTENMLLHHRRCPTLGGSCKRGDGGVLQTEYISAQQLAIGATLLRVVIELTRSGRGRRCLTYPRMDDLSSERPDHYSSSAEDGD
jgi:hypothetical protein